jgi:hypothetical protein
MAVMRWVPVAGDEVLVTSGALAVTGVISRWDPAVVVLDVRSPMVPALGERVRAAWSVDGVDFEGTASVEQVTDSAWTVRLDGPLPSPDFARRRDPRSALRARVTYTHPFSGSLDEGAKPARVIDISEGGLKVVLEEGTLTVGDVVEVIMDTDGDEQRLVSYVVWERADGVGGRAVGLRFRDEVRLDG